MEDFGLDLEVKESLTKFHKLNLRAQSFLNELQRSLKPDTPSVENLDYGSDRCLLQLGWITVLLEPFLCDRKCFGFVSKSIVLQTAFAHYFIAQHHKYAKNYATARIHIQRAICAFAHVNGPIYGSEQSHTRCAIGDESIDVICNVDSDDVDATQSPQQSQLIFTIVKCYLLAAQIEGLDGKPLDCIRLLTIAKETPVVSQSSENTAYLQNLIEKTAPLSHNSRLVAGISANVGLETVSVDDATFDDSRVAVAEGNNSTHTNTLQSVVKANDSGRWVCDICQRDYSSKKTLKTHRKLHTNEALECDICHKRFATAHKLKLHRRRHSGIKPFQCDLCLSTFSDKCNLTRHKRKHLSQTPYQCQSCHHSFTDYTAFTNHTREHSIHSDIPMPDTVGFPFKCLYCQHQFKTNSGLSTHTISIHRNLANKNNL